MSEFPKKQNDFVNLAGVIAIGLVGAIGVYVSFVALQAFYNYETGMLEEKREAQGKSNEVRSLLASQEAELKGYRWVDPQKQVVSLPIERAMELVVADARQGKTQELVPNVGPSVVPTVPAVYGRPPDGVTLPAQPATDTAAPADGTAVPADGTAAPADGTAAPAEGAAAPADGAAAPAAPAAAPAAPAAAGTPGAASNPGNATP